MSHCNWEAIHGFDTPGEYRRFCLWLELQVEAGIVENISIGSSKMGIPSGFDEKWFKCKESDEVWRLVAPDVLFPGLWAEVE